MYYHTFGHTKEKTKFRLVLFLDTLITDPGLRDWIQDGLLSLFPSSDQSVSDRNRFFFGSDKKGFVLSEQEVPLNLLTSVLDSDKLKQGGRMYKIGDNDYYHDTAVENYISSIIYNNKTITENSWTLTEKEEYRRQLKEQQQSRTVDWKKLEDWVQIFKDFMHREESLKYAELLGLTQNLSWLSGSGKLYRQRLEEFNEHHDGSNPYPRDGRFELCRRFHKRNKDARTCYFPMRLENFSPYKEDWKHWNLIEAESDFVRGVQITKEIRKMPLQKIQTTFQHQFRQAFNSLDNLIYIYKLPCSLGKTEEIKDIDDVVVAFPTHDLKREVHEERRTYRHTAMCTPEVPEFRSMELTTTSPACLS